ncbi:putative small metal-binding protein [Frankia sp. EI5c]|uniref:DUF1059 domain-containing protein n=1 Tax=Frankia sp. EI5c TaxID=683316 RepID=UPI0007C28487|nr:DUF1059 domain-containing protein [Frankia sp. EI5c]OAA18755.1 putative small metal-binding protein [Frankia sp. EI5c]OAA20929.1 putative small metal-binding protein [Frankia sp. EI5c]
MRRNRYWTAQALIGQRPDSAAAARVHEIAVARPPVMKEFYCGAIIHDCETRLVAVSEEEMLAAAARHALVEHGITEVPAELVEQVRRGIRDVTPAARQA